MHWEEFSLPQWLWYWLFRPGVRSSNPARTFYFSHAFINFFIANFVRKKRKTVFCNKSIISITEYGNFKLEKSSYEISLFASNLYIQFLNIDMGKTRI